MNTKILTCDGRCAEYGDCRGDVLRVTVKSSNGRSWGEYNYCAKARKTDTANGYTVEIKE